MRIDPSRLPSMTPARESSNECTRDQNMRKEFELLRKCLFSSICSEQVLGMFQGGWPSAPLHTGEGGGGSLQKVQKLKTVEGLEINMLKKHLAVIGVRVPLENVQKSKTAEEFVVQMLKSPTGFYGFSR